MSTAVKPNGRLVKGQHWWEVLDVDEAAAREEIIRAYKEKFFQVRRECLEGERPIGAWFKVHLAFKIAVTPSEPDRLI